MALFDVEHTDTFAGEANYSWVYRYTVSMPEMTHYGYDGTHSFVKARRTFDRELMRKAKAAAGLTGVRGRTERLGDGLEFRPYRACQVLFINYREE